jgi:hypothetical protein
MNRSRRAVDRTITLASLSFYHFLAILDTSEPRIFLNLKAERSKAQPSLPPAIHLSANRRDAPASRAGKRR